MVFILGNCLPYIPFKVANVNILNVPKIHGRLAFKFERIKTQLSVNSAKHLLRSQYIELSSLVGPEKLARKLE